MKKIMGAVWKLPAKQHSQSSPFSPKLGWIGCAIQQATSKQLPGFFFINILIFIYLFKYKTIETHARAFLLLNISAVGSVKWPTNQFQPFQQSRQQAYCTNIYTVLSGHSWLKRVKQPQMTLLQVFLHQYLSK